MGRRPLPNPPPLTQSEAQAKSDTVRSFCALTLLPRIEVLHEAGREIELSGLVLERLDREQFVTDDELSFGGQLDESMNGESTKIAAEHAATATRVRDFMASIKPVVTDIVLDAPPTNGGPPGDVPLRLECLTATRKIRSGVSKAVGPWTDEIVEEAQHGNGSTKTVSVWPDYDFGTSTMDGGVPDQDRVGIEYPYGEPWVEFGETWVDLGDGTGLWVS